MLASVIKALTRPAAGPIASATALALAAALAASWAHAARTEAQLRSQVAALAASGRSAELVWRARLDSCRAQAAQDGAPLGEVVTRTAGDGDTVAARLASEGPAGFDVCARMEAADRAVLASLSVK
jgi:hypothetical protein